ncbi:MAG: transglutaminase-like domain-containing protein, partial [Candidatus Pacearchaeota archaeon]|nr:transglutaminase-like domain-containing protein [Candidatus Pacearchaeota archaeon]
MKKSTKKIKAKNHDGLIDIIIDKIYQIDSTATKNPVVVKKAKELKGKTKSETIKNCFEYVYKNVKYCDDPAGTEHITSPWLLIEKKKTCEDCESMVLLLSSLLRANGIKTRYKVLSWKNPKDLRFSHIVLEADDNGKWLILDATMKSAGYGHTVTP